MTAIDFYFNAGDRLAVACRLAGKAVQRRKRVLVYAPQPELAQKFDRMLWTWQAISFVPHCYVEDALAAETPVLIAAGNVQAPDCEILINLDAACPPSFERHGRLLEVVAQDDEDRRAGRARYAFYRGRGYAIRGHDLATEGRN